MDELEALHALAVAQGVQTRFTDGLGRVVRVHPETLVAVCAAQGAAVSRPADAAEALRALRAERAEDPLPPVLVAWDGQLDQSRITGGEPARAELLMEQGEAISVDTGERADTTPLPWGYHRLTVAGGDGTRTSTVISAPLHTWRRPGPERVWGLGTHLAALRSRRSRSLGDLRDLESLCRWVADQGGDLVTVLPLLPTFNQTPAEPSPYAPVSRLFWSELVLDLGEAHRTVDPPPRLDVARGDAEVRSALGRTLSSGLEDPDDELARYARFRGAQARLGRNWRQWPEGPRSGVFEHEQIDPDEERFHRVAQGMARNQLVDLKERLDGAGVRLGLDLSVGVHPDGYDPWSRPELFAEGMSVGAPPDPGFPSGQNWGFAPVLPGASRREGHRYLAASIAHQAALAGVLRIDHVMALTRLYWIPHGAHLDQGTYVHYPTEELFATLSLESHRNRCEIVGENLGTVPPETEEALARHGVLGTYLAQFEAGAEAPRPPRASVVAMVGTHDTATFAGWLDGTDIDERHRVGLLGEAQAAAERGARAEAVQGLAQGLEGSPADPEGLLAGLLAWLGRSESPLVIPWIEDLWLERHQVNVPGTRSSERPNWQRPMALELDVAMRDPGVQALVRVLRLAREEASGPVPSP